LKSLAVRQFSSCGTVTRQRQLRIIRVTFLHHMSPSYHRVYTHSSRGSGAERLSKSSMLHLSYIIALAPDCLDIVLRNCPLPHLCLLRLQLHLRPLVRLPCSDRPPSNRQEHYTEIHNEGPIECCDSNIGNWRPEREEPSNKAVDESHDRQWYTSLSKPERSPRDVLGGSCESPVQHD
jgi:hypothetical protein